METKKIAAVVRDVLENLTNIDNPLVYDETVAKLQEIETRLEDTANVPDGFHTFEEMYDHRCSLFCALAIMWADRAWKSKLHHDGTMFDGGWFIAGIDTPYGPITYHLELRYWDRLDVHEVARAPEWDGHTPADVVKRLQLCCEYEGALVPSELQVWVLEADYVTPNGDEITLDVSPPFINQYATEELAVQAGKALFGCDPADPEADYSNHSGILWEAVPHVVCIETHKDLR